MKIALVTRDLKFGIGTHVTQLANQLEAKGFQVDIKLGKGNYRTNVLVSKLDRSKKYDIIHIHGSAFGAFGNAETPRIVTVHSLLKTELKYQWKFSYKFGIPFENKTLAKATKVIAVSNVIKEELRELYNCSEEKVTVIPNALDFSEFDKIKAEKVNEKFVMSCGRKIKRKNFATLIKACKLGDISYKLFHGQVNRYTLLKTMKQASTVVVPSLYESFGLAVLEAMGAKTPVIASDIPVFRELIKNGETGLLFSKKNPVDLMEKMRWILYSEEKVNKMVLKAYKSAKNKFSWVKVIPKIVGVLEETL